MAATQLFVQGAGLVLGSGIAELSVKAAALLSVPDIIKSIAFATGVMTLCLALIVRVVLVDGNKNQAGALNRLLGRAFGRHAGVARLTQQMFLIAGMPSIARSAFALVMPSFGSVDVDSALHQAAAVAFVAACVALKVYASRALDAFNATTGWLEVARWVVMVGVLACLAYKGLTTEVHAGNDTGNEHAGNSAASAASAASAGNSAVVSVAMTAMYGFGGMEVMVDKIGGQGGVSPRGFVQAVGAVLLTTALLYLSVPVLVSVLVPLDSVVSMHTSDNRAALSDVLLRLCLQPLQLTSRVMDTIGAGFDALVFVSLINGVSSLADFNVDCLRNIGQHSATDSVLRHVHKTSAAGMFVCVVSTVFCVFASDLIAVVSALILLSHFITGIAFWAVLVRPTSRGFVDCALWACHAAAMAVMLVVLLWTSSPEEKWITLVLIAAVTLLPLLAVYWH
jgi:hypothetical protein